MGVVCVTDAEITVVVGMGGSDAVSVVSRVWLCLGMWLGLELQLWVLVWVRLGMWVGV